MQSQEIPARQWSAFLDTISRKHQGETVSIEMQKDDAKTHNESRELRLVGISFDSGRSRATEIDVMVRNDVNAHLMHAIVQPSHVQIARTDEGLDCELHVKSKDGLTTLVRFTLPIPR